MCQNLGSAFSSDMPFPASWGQNGAYWQWGQKEVGAPGPDGADEGTSNEGLIVGWNSRAAEDGAWEESGKSLNDPCPEGFRIPTHAEWKGILDYNARRTSGAWVEGASNFSSGLWIGDALYLPAAGLRKESNGVLLERGLQGHYWSSSGSMRLKAWSLSFSERGASVLEIGRAAGLSVRCIRE